ncbi:PTS fructose transporter subunit IIB [Klebsiella sp. BIGb0407]|uniref:PTS fructose transporter subunit IIB n=1 Tax=Klebsiella sp. BIGb0407 TaxID=2940603 RepID=UPI0021699A4D|nr:PTS fructose transporter subunit IIB [Klebsiella sp. BIGb0407]MCS3432925.1 fructose-specific phosphotransferase system IIB component [Klebsiella sp. BIGb0407]
MTRSGKESLILGGSDRKLYFVAVTACATGVAHTYMAAEQLEKLAKEYNFAVKIETQGVLGIKNKITSKDVEECDLVIIASDIMIDSPSRFEGFRVINVKISSLLINPSEVMGQIKRIINQPKGKVVDI